MPEKNKYPKTIDAVPATSLAGSGAAVAQLLSAEARPSSSNNLEAQSRSDDSSFFYFSQPSDLSASDSEVGLSKKTSLKNHNYHSLFRNESILSMK